MKNQPVFQPQLRIPAIYARGGTSKGIFLNLADLPLSAQQPGCVRDAILLRALGSPDPYGKQIDGMGNASSSTSKAVILSRSTQAGHDVDYLFGQVSIDKPLVDWSGNCGNLSAAVGPVAVEMGLIAPEKLPKGDGVLKVHIWQVNIQKTIIAHVPIKNGQVQELGDFELDGVTFPAAEIPLEFIDPADDADGASIFPTGHVMDVLEVPGVGTLDVTMINSGIPTIFLNAADIGCTGVELQNDVNQNAALLKKLELIRAYGALKMGLIDDIAQAAQRQHTPKVAFVAPVQNYITSSGKWIQAADMDLLARALSMGQLHHAMMGTAAVALGTAAAIEGTLVCRAAGGVPRGSVRFGHPSGTLRVGADVVEDAGAGWRVQKALMSRSARILMQGHIRVPDCVLKGDLS